MELDQVGNAEGCPIVQLRTFQAHLVLTDHGELALEALGDGTGQHIVSSVYPLLDAALSDAYGDGEYDSYEALPPDRRAAIAHAIEKERGRIARESTPRPPLSTGSFTGTPQRRSRASRAAASRADLAGTRRRA